MMPDYKYGINVDLTTWWIFCDKTYETVVSFFFEVRLFTGFGMLFYLAIAGRGSNSQRSGKLVIDQWADY
ncbi:hypothetical protein EOK75_04010 [Pseudorhodobacter turbinis]|uniref:Uncharacterized protein n=1 Tax=Pseudorhodobacter turbinis TaxID=2500533 RepID=A0A4P8EE43_9RHOB|nr:hypothetical protein [Pseudorhodobacter turbinis]QCO55022.1 hypothetical protein EOK75_04010 [Pseudorhodobacter turbinis]